jgi:hypothetical protein
MRKNLEDVYRGKPQDFKTLFDAMDKIFGVE